MIEVKHSLGRDRFTLMLTRHRWQGSLFAIAFGNWRGHGKSEVLQVGGWRMRELGSYQESFLCNCFNFFNVTWISKSPSFFLCSFLCWSYIFSLCLTLIKNLILLFRKMTSSYYSFKLLASDDFGECYTCTNFWQILIQILWNRTGNKILTACDVSTVA